MIRQNYVAEISPLHSNPRTFRVLRLTNAADERSEGPLLDPTVIYADRDALQVVLAGKLGLDFPAVRVDLRN